MRVCTCIYRGAAVVGNGIPSRPEERNHADVSEPQGCHEGFPGAHAQIRLYSRVLLLLPLRNPSPPRTSLSLSLSLFFSHSYYYTSRARACAATPSRLLIPFRRCVSIRSPAFFFFSLSLPLGARFRELFRIDLRPRPLGRAE